MNGHSDQIDPRPTDLGGGWPLRLLERGEDVGGGVFPLSEYTTAEHAEEAASDACQCLAFQGLMTFSPAASKGLVSRVATAKPLASATAAMKASAVSTAKPAARDVTSSSA